jgi:hypothetical protein
VADFDGGVLMARLITADASKVSAKQFLRHVFGPPIHEVLAAMSDEEFEREYQACLKRKGDPLVAHMVGEKFRRCLMARNEALTDVHRDRDTGNERVAA